MKEKATRTRTTRTTRRKRRRRKRRMPLPLRVAGRAAGTGDSVEVRWRRRKKVKKGRKKGGATLKQQWQRKGCAVAAELKLETCDSLAKFATGGTATTAPALKIGAH